MSRHFFLGIGQGKKSVDWLTTQCTGIIFHEAPHYFKYRSPQYLRNAGLRYVTSKLRYERPGYVLYAESQAAPAVIEALVSDMIPTPSRLVLRQPHGLNKSSLGTTDKQRRAEILKRSREFWGQPTQSLKIQGNRWTIAEILLQSIPYAYNLPSAFLIGSNQDCSKSLEIVARKLRIDIFACVNDSLFPYAEIARHLKQGEHVELQRLPGNHLNRATPLGVKQLRAILSL